MTYGNYPDLTPVKRVLVVKLRHLGDVLLTTPVFSALKKVLPQASLDAFIYQESLPLLEGHPALSEALVYDRAWKRLSLPARLAREARLLWRIRKRRYDLILNLTEGDRGAMVARFSGSALRVGVDQRKVYTHVAKQCGSPRHTVERQLDVLRSIGIFPEGPQKELFLAIPEEAKALSLQKVPWERFVLLHPTSRWRFKCWPVRQVRALAKRLLERGERLVFTSGPDLVEQAMVAEIVEGLGEGVCNLAGLLSLKELGALIERASALVCVDSLPFHMASALKAPVVALFGPTSDVTWGPWRNPHARVVAENMSCRPCYMDGCAGSKRSECLYAITVERVLSALDELLAPLDQPKEENAKKQYAER